MRRAIPPLRLLTVFEAVVRNQTLQGAAAELNVTQPAISQALRQLEDHLGTRLIDRSRRPVVVTEAGQILRAAVTDGLNRIAEAVSHIRLLQAPDERTITVACSVGIATYWLMPRLALFHDSHPEITVNVATTPQGAPRLMPGIDIAIRYGDGRWSDGSVVKLFEERVLPVCSPALLAQGGGTLDLAEAPLLHVRADEDSWLTWPEYLQRAGLPPNRATGRSFTNYVQAMQAALAGHGVLLGWRSISDGVVAEGRLVPAGAVPVVPKEAFYLISAQGETRDAARVMRDWLCAAV